jgi:Tfp pilus assembly protein PilF
MSRVHNFFGLVLSGRGMLGDAAREFHVAIDLDPNFGEPYNNLGAALGMDGRLDEAAREFAEAIRVDPYCYGAYNNLGTVYAKRGDVRRALGLYAKSLSIEPDYDGAADNLNELIKSNQLPAPLGALAKAISDNPRDKAAHQALAEAIQ